MQDKVKVILDTDIGDDIDDAFALALLLNEEKADLLGVTTVFRNTYQRAKMASYFISSFHKKIPVYAGIDAPLIQKEEDLIPPEIRKKEKKDERGKYYIPQYLPIMDEAKIEDKHAVDFIIETVHKYPHEVVIFAIGPLTNIAVALRKDPTICSLIKEIRIMGGEPYKDEIREWNIFCDPEAAHIVMDAPVPFSMVGLNVTLKCQLLPAYRALLKEAKKEEFGLLDQMMEKWFAHYEFTVPVMHDPLAVASYFTPIVTFKEDKMKVDLMAKRAATIHDEKGRNIMYASDVNVEEFFRYFLKTIFGKEMQL